MKLNSLFGKKESAAPVVKTTEKESEEKITAGKNNWSMAISAPQEEFKNFSLTLNMDEGDSDSLMQKVTNVQPLPLFMCSIKYLTSQGRCPPPGAGNDSQVLVNSVNRSGNILTWKTPKGTLPAGKAVMAIITFETKPGIEEGSLIILRWKAISKDEIWKYTVKFIIKGASTGFFVFNYNTMDNNYGQQAFRAIYASLLSSPGICAFHDGDIRSIETIKQLAGKAKRVVPSTVQSQLANLSGSPDFGPYIAAMWTDNTANFEKVHDALVSTSLPGYLGYILSNSTQTLKDAINMFSSQLSLPSGIFLNNGSIVEGTPTKYGVGSNPSDEVLFYAAQSGDIEKVRKALDEGANINFIRHRDGSIPILEAVNGGHLEVVKLLIQKGANLNNNALKFAARHGNVEMVKALIAGGANVNYRDRFGETALSSAKEHPDIQQILREAGAN